MLTRLLPGLFVFIWATGFIVAGIVAGRADPLTFLSARHALSIGVFAALSFAAGAPWPRGFRPWRDAMLAGMLLHGFYIGGVGNMDGSLAYPMMMKPDGQVGLMVLPQINAGQAVVVDDNGRFDRSPGLATGPQGPQGPAGTTGAVGPQGPVGATGGVGPARGHRHRLLVLQSGWRSLGAR